MRIIRTVLMISALTTGAAVANITNESAFGAGDYQTEQGRAAISDRMFASDVRPGQSQVFIVAGDAPCNPKVTVCDD